MFTKNVNIIKNIEIPSCKSCIHYKPSLYDTDFDSTTSRCEKFGEKNMITEQIVFDFADCCRRDETKCGKEGKYFEREKNLNLKIFTHKFITSLPYSIIVSLIIFELLELSIMNNNSN
jgi:hypothetical protein